MVNLAAVHVRWGDDNNNLTHKSPGMSQECGATIIIGHSKAVAITPTPARSPGLISWILASERLPRSFPIHTSSIPHP